MQHTHKLLFAILIVFIFSSQLIVNFNFFRTSDDLNFALTTKQMQLPLGQKLHIIWQWTLHDYGVANNNDPLFTANRSAYAATNDRFLGQLLSRVIEILPPATAAVVKSTLFTLMIWLFFLLGTFYSSSARQNPLFLLLTFFLFWVPSFPFGEAFVYNAGVGNHLVGAIFIGLYLHALLCLFRKSSTMQPHANFLARSSIKLFLLGMLAGDAEENGSLALLALSGLFILTNLIREKRYFLFTRNEKNLPVPFYFGFLGNAVGSLVIFLSPTFTHRLHSEAAKSSMSHWSKGLLFFFGRYPLHLFGIIGFIGFLFLTLFLMKKWISKGTGTHILFFNQNIARKSLLFLALAVLSNAALAVGGVSESRALTLTAAYLILFTLTLLANLELTPKSRSALLRISAALLALMWIFVYCVVTHRMSINHKEWIETQQILKAGQQSGTTKTLYVPMYTQFPLSLNLYIRKTAFDLQSTPTTRSAHLISLERIYGLAPGQVQWQRPLTPRQKRLRSKQ